VSTNNEIKLKKLLDLHVPGTIILASWLEANGFSYDLQQRYRKSGWLESVGVGAFKRPNETVTWQGALYSLQKQASLPIYIGGLTALSMLGFSHYIRTDAESVYLFSDLKTRLPAWFKKYSWREPINHIRTSFLPKGVGMDDYNEKPFSLTIASPERAIFECLYLTPGKLDLMETYQIMSGLVNLRPGILQKLLEGCNSIKVKRLFLYMSKKTNNQWAQFLDLSSVDFGQGDRSIVKHGVYDPKFRITIPKELAQL
jgi:Transcriptional regulator, AbiEi antitoxin, Type IV TA system/Transcriptional regulator, AbiEi antitoxin N-terminal domain